VFLVVGHAGGVAGGEGGWPLRFGDWEIGHASLAQLCACRISCREPILSTMVGLEVNSYTQTTD